MNKYIELIAKIEMGHIVKDIASKEINFNFDENNSDEIKKETAKLIHFFSLTTYINVDCIRLYFINDGLLYYEESMLEYIRKLYYLNQDHRSIDEECILAYYLISLNYSYNQGLKYKSNKKNKEHLQLFYSIFDKRQFYQKGDIFNNAVNFACEVILYAIKNNVWGLQELTLDSCRICRESSCKDLQSYINKLIRLKTYYNKYFIAYDNEIQSNFQIYFNYTLSRISQGLNDDITVLRVLYQNGLINTEHEELILTTLQDRLTCLESEDDFIRKLAFFEMLQKDIYKIRNSNYTSAKLKEELKTLVNDAQSKKRKLIKYNEPDYRTIEHTIDLPREYIDEVNEAYERNLIQKICEQCIIRFDGLFESSIERMVDSIANLASSFSIDNKAEGLFTGDDKDVPDSAFNKYYSDRMEEYIKNNNGSYLNPHMFNKKNAYKGLLDYAKFLYPIQLGLSANLVEQKFAKEAEAIILNRMYDSTTNTYNNNYYIMLFLMIIRIEEEMTQLYNHLKNENNTMFKDQYLEYIFEHLKKNELYANGIMYINFVLYDKNGLRLRDKLAHGNYPSGFRSLQIFLPVVVSAVISHLFCNTLSRD